MSQTQNNLNMPVLLRYYCRLEKKHEKKNPQLWYTLTPTKDFALFPMYNYKVKTRYKDIPRFTRHWIMMNQYTGP